MCGGHHGWGEGASCCSGGGHQQHGCCSGGGHQQHGCCCGGGHQRHGYCCGGGHPFGFHRRFSTREEEAAALEDYLKELEAETKGVREHLAEMRS